MTVGKTHPTLIFYNVQGRRLSLRIVIMYSDLCSNGYIQSVKGNPYNQTSVRETILMIYIMTLSNENIYYDQHPELSFESKYWTVIFSRFTLKKTCLRDFLYRWSSRHTRIDELQILNLTDKPLRMVTKGLKPYLGLISRISKVKKAFEYS